MCYKCIPPGRILGAEEAVLVFRIVPLPTDLHLAFWVNFQLLKQTVWGNETTVMTVV